VKSVKGFYLLFFCTLIGKVCEATIYIQRSLKRYTSMCADLHLHSYSGYHDVVFKQTVTLSLTYLGHDVFGCNNTLNFCKFND